MGDTKHPTPTFRDTTSLLRYLYTDLTRISQVSSEDIVLHPADRAIRPREPLRGIVAAQAHEEALIAATGGTLVMDVQSISANNNFGAVLGILRSKRKRVTAEGRLLEEENLAIPFCGVWRFVNGKAVEHWENATDPAELGRWLGPKL
ncbi:nuclear transport factor 2 family protein [Diplogelasinospora grovesii]|uniref:Nuclear transport factor 2 family protein n=1 Tax=Diplogelasinospora grovesii TaxID=303347 RepID=A0AAN6N762_9PEZI|nr:nuclear transport factor 2 family protein [Diplogelasinospora grovesii]